MKIVREKWEKHFKELLLWKKLKHAKENSVMNPQVPVTQAQKL